MGHREKGGLIECGVPSKLHRSHDVLQVRPTWEEHFQLLGRLESEKETVAAREVFFGCRGRE